MYVYIVIITFAASHLTLAAREARAVAALAEERKRAKYLDLAQTHHFVAVVVETTGAMGTDALDFFADVGSRVRAVSNEAQSRSFILYVCMYVHIVWSAVYKGTVC